MDVVLTSVQLCEPNSVSSVVKDLTTELNRGFSQSCTEGYSKKTIFTLSLLTIRNYENVSIHFYNLIFYDFIVF